jgi:hypothetical protein
MVNVQNLLTLVIKIRESRNSDAEKSAIFDSEKIHQKFAIYSHSSFSARVVE